MKRILLFVLVCCCVEWTSCCGPDQMSDIVLLGHDSARTTYGWLAATQIIGLQFGISTNDVNETLKIDGDQKSSFTSVYYPKNQIGKPAFKEIGLSCIEDTAALSWNEIKDYICCDKTPIAFTYGGEKTFGHILIIMGYTSIHGTNYLHVFDPEIVGKHAERYISYEEYLDPHGMDTRWTTWYNFDRNFF